MALDLKGSLTAAFDGVKDKLPKGDTPAPAAPESKSPAWAVAFVDNLRKDPTVKIDDALAAAAKNVPNDGTATGRAKAMQEASEIINKEINIQIKSHPEDAEKLKAAQKALGGEPAKPSVADKIGEIGKSGIGGLLKKKIHFP